MWFVKFYGTGQSTFFPISRRYASRANMAFLDGHVEHGSLQIRRCLCLPFSIDGIIAIAGLWRLSKSTMLTIGLRFTARMRGWVY